jgi:hypothetical protein
VSVRATSPRDPHDRGLRGPLVTPDDGPVVRPGRRPRPHRDTFDDLVLRLVRQLLRRWPDELSDVEFGTEDVPDLPADWGDEPMPFGALTPARPGVSARIVVFRRPIELRAPSRVEQTMLVHEVLVENVAELLGRDPDDIAP